MLKNLSERSKKTNEEKKIKESVPEAACNSKNVHFGLVIFRKNFHGFKFSKFLNNSDFEN